MNDNYNEYETSSDRNKKLSVKKYLDKIKPYLRDIIINLEKSDTWKIQLAIAINFNSSKDVDEEHIMHSKSNNIKFMTYDNANKTINELFESLLSRYQIGSETSMRGSNFFLIQFNCWIINVKSKISNVGDHILILQTG